MNYRRIPIGIQDFKKLRENGFLYVDKTAYIYELVKLGAPVFLSRPRRFGKSLFISTLKYYFEGRRELFHGLAIEELAKDDPDAFEAHPVFHFDFNGENYSDPQALERILSYHLDIWEEIYGKNIKHTSLSERFMDLLRSSCEKTGNKAVILIDEYDKPLLEVMQNKELLDHNRMVFKGFFSTLKSYDQYIQFVFITGVTRFSKVSLFSDLNQLSDISLDREYAEICGITEEELTCYFIPEIESLAEEEEMTASDCLTALKKKYDGYHFHPKGKGLYNPFSLLNTLQKKAFGSYWFSSGTPRSLVERLKTGNFDLKLLSDGTLTVKESVLANYLYDDPNPLPLLYQTGYLTISGYDREFGDYILSYPNEEVKYAFLESLLPVYLNRMETSDPLDIRYFVADIRKGNLDSLRDRFIAIFAKLPYDQLRQRDNDPDGYLNDAPLEINFQNVIYLVFMLLGQYIQAETHTAKGRADVIVQTKEFIYIFEFKRDGTVEEALRQIEEKGYALPFAADSRTLYKIGVSFDSRERNLIDWKAMQ